MNDLARAISKAELLVFDKDGVLLDFISLWGTLTHLRAEALCGLAGRPELLNAACALLGLGDAGKPHPDGLLAVGTRQEAQLASGVLLHQHGLGWPRARAIAEAAFNAADAALDFEACCRPFVGLDTTLIALRSQGHKLAIATSDTTAGARRFLEKAGLEGLFSAVVGADMVVSTKPAPDLFLRACALAGACPEKSLMIGDTPADLLMGRAAGARGVIGVLSGLGDLERLGPHADWVLKDVNALLASP